jgi:hypothetical protein
MLCCSSLSADETNYTTAKKTAAFFAASVKVSKKNQSSASFKVKLQVDKARPCVCDNGLPGLPQVDLGRMAFYPCLIKVAVPYQFENFSYQYIFNHLYPKHTFW